jgi:hypothetical protein
VAGGRGQFGWRYADIAGVRSPPLRETGTPTRGTSGFKARCIGKAPCRHYARGGALGKPRSGLSG